MHSADLLEKRLTTLLSVVGIKPRQARILNALSRMGEVSQSALMDSFDVTSGSMSTMIDRMQQGGLVQRWRDPKDRRSDLISVTEHGNAVLAEVRDVWRELDNMIEAELGAERAAQLVALTRQLKYALGGKLAASQASVEQAQRATKTGYTEGKPTKNR